MAFMIFKKERSGDGVYYSNSNQGYKLAGNGLLYNLWNKRNKPVECGWSVTAADLLKEHGEELSSDDYALVIDAFPSSTSLISLVEIEAIHVYTYGGDSGASWSPMMLELREVCYYDDEPFTQNQKHVILARFDLLPTRKKIIELLYLQGNWNWGKNGLTNAAFIHDAARSFFQPIFNKAG